MNLRIEAPLPFFQIALVVLQPIVLFQYFEPSVVVVYQLGDGFVR